MAADGNGMRMTAEEARNLLHMKKESFLKTLSIIRQMCDTSIKEACRRGRDRVKFDIPITLFAREYYDPKTMGKELAQQLFEDGFDVVGPTPLHLTVTWSKSTSDGEAGDKSDGDVSRPRGGGIMGGMPVPFTSAFSSNLRSAPVKKGKKVEMQIGAKR
jgi:hypothetical protein